MKKERLFFVLLSLLAFINGMADDRVIRYQIHPEGFDNNNFGIFFYNANNIYNVRGTRLFSGFPVVTFKVNPSNTSLAAIQCDERGMDCVLIYDVNPTHPLRRTPIKIIKMEDANATALAYSADAKQLAIGSSDMNIAIYDAITNKPNINYKSNLRPNKLVFSDNGNFLGATDQKTLEIWNLERGVIRTTLTAEADIHDFCFSNNSKNLLVLMANGKMNVYDTKTFEVKYTIEDLGNAIACYPNHNGKYVAVVNSDKLISVVNILDPTERHMVNEEDGGISDVRMLRHPQSNATYLMYNFRNAVVYHLVEGLTPYYNKMMTGMLNERLNQWMKQMPGESMEDYQLRVNEASRLEQTKAIERELATKMATGLLEQSQVSIGDYNTASKSLALKFNTMPDIFIDVPMEDVNSFTDASQLEFRNAKYGLNPDDKFELIYAEVYNPATGKTYTFDNMEHRSLAYMQEDADFVPLEIIQKSNMEETALMNIKEDVMTLAKQDNVITDKTHISVKTEAVNAVNADGQKIVNYNVDFTYEVEEEFSARDDFKPGHYHVEESKAAMLMLQIMTKAFEKDFAKYVVQGKRVKIKVKGTADASPINNTLKYDGAYGEYDGEPVYKNTELNNISLNKKEGIADNEQLAFARALGVKKYIENKVSSFADMQCDYEYHIEVSKEEGSKYRRISVQYTFIDAF